MHPEAKSLAGDWRQGGGLAGSDLYLFGDSSYIYTQWNDIQPETIHDKGSWTLDAGLLVLAPDADVTWQPKTDRRFLVLQSTDDKPENLLFGLAQGLSVFEMLVADDPGRPAVWLRLSSLTRQRAWTPAEGIRAKARVMMQCSRPSHVTASPCPP